MSKTPRVLRERGDGPNNRPDPLHAPLEEHATASASALLSVQEAAKRLGIKPTTLYDWLGQSDHGLLMIRGQAVTIQYFQGGPRGQGRIRIEADEVDRLLDLMRVRPQFKVPRLPAVHRDLFPGITVPLGRPDRQR